MATNPIGGDAAPVTLPGTMPPMPAVARILGRFDRAKLGAAIEVMIALLDAGEPDLEAEPGAWPENARAVDHAQLPEDAEAVGDEHDAAWLEWEDLPPCRRTEGNRTAGPEDAEEDDHGEEDDAVGQSDEDGINTGLAHVFGYGVEGRAPGCNISDPGEAWQATSNVPMPLVVSADHNLFTDRRTTLGIGNLQSSYRPGAAGVLSADSGRVHHARRRKNNRPGQPV